MKIALWAACLLFSAPLSAQPLPSTVETLTQKGLNEIYLMDFADAEKDFQKLIDDAGGHPFGYFGLAATKWTRLVYGSQVGDEALEADFWKQSDNAIREINAWIKTHPRDAKVFLTLGGALGVRSRLLVFKKQWLSAAWEGRHAVKAMRQAHQIDPELYDAYLGIGTWEYFADILPRFIKVLSKLLLGGDRELGIKHLRLAAQKARYVSVTSSLILIEIYLTDRYGSRNPEEALCMVRVLRKKYPGSPFFHQIEQTCLFDIKDYDNLRKLATDYARRIKEHQPHYDADHWPLVFTTLGTMNMAERDLEAARQEFAKCLPYLGEKNRPNQWALWGLMRLGQVEDLLGDREAAKNYYRQLLPYKDFWGYHALAASYIKKPFKLDVSTMRLPPPS